MLINKGKYAMVCMYQTQNQRKPDYSPLFLLHYLMQRITIKNNMIIV